MLRALCKKITSGDNRTVLLKKNILSSFLIKGWGCLVQFLLVPITLNCLNQYEYGIWLTINSILVWIDTFDIGLGNGLRNNLAEAIAKKDYARAKRLTSTTFIMLIGIIIPIIAIVFLLINIFDVYSFLNVERDIAPNLKGVLMISFALVGATFVFKFIGNIYLALQLPAINNLLVVSGQTVSLIGIVILSKSNFGSLTNVAVIYTLSPLIVYLISYPITFTKYNWLRPSLFSFDKTELNSLFSLGIRFFFLQIGALILFTTSNILISKLFSPKEVTPYQISYRYFGLVNIIFTIISTPIWSATTNAYVNNEKEWIINTNLKMKKIVYTFFVVLGIMVVISPIFFHLWIGNKVHIPLSMSVIIAIYMCTVIYSTCYSNFICGIGKIRLLTIITLIEAIVYIPLAISLTKVFGLTGIITALLITNIVSCIFNKLQFSKIMNGNAIGIWNK